MYTFFSALYKSLLIYFMTPLFAAGAITEDEIHKFETLLIREQFGLKWEIKSEDIDKLMTLYIEKTASLVATLGSKLRNKIEISQRAKGKKRFVIREEPKDEEKAKMAQRVELQLKNHKSAAINAEDAD